MTIEMHICGNEGTSIEGTVEIYASKYIDFIVQLFSTCIVIPEMDLHNKYTNVMSKVEDHRKKVHVMFTSTIQLILAKQGK